jgi:hypothetical protein
MSRIKHIDYMYRAILFIDLEGSASDFEVIDLGEKAKKLVKLSRRTEVSILYNLTGVVMTKQLMLNMKRLIEHSSMVSRRVIFGIDPKYKDLIRQMMIILNLAEKTRYADNYTQAVNLMVDDAEWVERRHVSMPHGEERRLDPKKVNEADFMAKINKMGLPIYEGN